MYRKSFIALLPLGLLLLSSCRNGGTVGPLLEPTQRVTLRGYTCAGGELLFPQPLPGARVAVRMLGGFLKEEYITDSTGYYEAHLLPGTYIVEPQPRFGDTSRFAPEPITHVLRGSEIVCDSFYYRVGLVDDVVIR